MKVKWKMLTLTLAFGLTFTGCGTVGWDTGSSPSPEREAVTAPETLPTREDTDTAAFIEGEHTLLRCEPPIPGGASALTGAFQAGDALILLWRGGGGAALTAVNPTSGESLYSTALGGSVYGAAPELLTPGEYRIDSVDRVAYGSVSGEGVPDDRELPVPVRDGLRQDYPAALGAPYDLFRDAAVAYAAVNGIILANWEGEKPVTVLDNAAIADWLGYWGLDAEQYDPALLFYIAPKIMAGGKYVAATACYAGEDGPRCLGIASVEIRTNRITYFPDPVGSGEAPAERLTDDVLHARGEAGDILMTLSAGEAERIPYDEDGGERYSFDYASFARMKATTYADGFREFELTWGPLGQREDLASLLKLGGYARVDIVAVTEGTILLEAEVPGGDISYLAVKI